MSGKFIAAVVTAGKNLSHQIELMRRDWYATGVLSVLSASSGPSIPLPDEDCSLGKTWINTEHPSFGKHLK